jgi:hypothetical protein
LFWRKARFLIENAPIEAIALYGEIGSDNFLSHIPRGIDCANNSNFNRTVANFDRLQVGHGCLDRYK